MRYIFTLLLSVFCFQVLIGQPIKKEVQRPKLVVGIVIDQMRWDFLYRYANRYSSNGFNRFLNEGFNCENTFIPYAQTVTAAGHASIYTGSVPAIHGIMGNEWYDKTLGKLVYCTEDENVKIIGAENALPQSPRNLWASSICDELKLATNFRSKVIGISLKDRGGILPAGHAANAAYWYDSKSGNWISSTYYMQELPLWVNRFNARKMTDSLYKSNWNTLYPISSYIQSDNDDVKYEGKYAHETKPVFPHELSSQIGKNYGLISVTPFGNTISLSFAKAAIENEQMGKDSVTDFIAISLSSPDYIGHQFGPNSIEIEDTYLRLDRDLASFFSHLDAKIGKGNYTTFLSADHGVAHIPEYLSNHKIAALSLTSLTTEIANAVEAKFKIKNSILSTANYQIYLNDNLIDSVGVEKAAVKEFIINKLNKNSNTLIAFDTDEISEVNLPSTVKEMFINGFNTKLGGDIQVVLKPSYFNGWVTGTTHGSWYNYDSHIPLLWYGWGIKKGKSNSKYYMNDIAPTLAALLHIQMPNGATGNVITEVLK